MIARVGLFVLALLIVAGLGAALSLAWPADNEVSARHTVQQAGVPTTEPTWRTR